MAQRKESIADEFRARKSSAIVGEIIPETAVETPSAENDKQLGAGKNHTPKPSNGNGDGKKPVASTSSTAAKAGASKGSTNGTSKPTTLKTIARPAAISTAKTSVAPKASPKTKGSMPKTPTTPSQSHLRDTSSKAADIKASKKASAPSRDVKVYHSDVYYCPYLSAQSENSAISSPDWLCQTETKIAHATYQASRVTHSSYGILGVKAGRGPAASTQAIAQSGLWKLSR